MVSIDLSSINKVSDNIGKYFSSLNNMEKIGWGLILGGVVLLIVTLIVFGLYY